MDYVKIQTMLQNTIDWYGGEILEAKFFIAFGVFLLCSTVLLYIYGNPSSAKALIIPLIVIGILIALLGFGGVYSNSHKIVEVEQSFKQNQKEFVEAEISRVEGLNYYRPLSIAISLLCFLFAIGILYFVKNIQWQAIAIALILFGSAFTTVNYFANERTITYYNKLILE